MPARAATDERGGLSVPPRAYGFQRSRNGDRLLGNGRWDGTPAPRRSVRRCACRRGRTRLAAEGRGTGAPGRPPRGEEDGRRSAGQADLRGGEEAPEREPAHGGNRAAVAEVFAQ